MIIDGEVQYAVQYEAELVRDQKDAYRREELDQATEDLPALPIKSKAKKKKQSKSGSRESIKIKQIQNRVSKRTEKVAQSRLKLAKQLLGQKQNAKAKKWLNRILEKYPATKSAKEAKQILKQSLGSFSSDEM